MPDNQLYSKDLAPVPPEKRTWNTWNYTALWISMSLCIPTYMLASSLIEGGMNWWQAILTIFLGNSIVLIPMILNGHAGAKYGIPFPVFCQPCARRRSDLDCHPRGLSSTLPRIAFHLATLRACRRPSFNRRSSRRR